MHRILIASLSIATHSLAAAADPWNEDGERPAQGSDVESQSLAVVLLKELNERENSAYERMETATTKEDINRIKADLQTVVDGYETLLARTDDYAPAYVSYGMMLQRIGEREASYAMFIKADELDPTLAIVKNQLGNFQAEEGNYQEALGFYILAADIDPRESLYQYQMGNLLFEFRKFFIDDKLYSPSAIDLRIQEHFQNAMKRDPKNIQYKLRFAQSFFDVGNPNWILALETWQEIRDEVEEPFDKQVAILYIARVRMELEHFSAARKLLNSVDAVELSDSKQTLIDDLVLREASR